MSDWLATVLEEYRSLREEAVSARDAQLAVLRFGVAIVGVLVALGVALREDQNSLLTGIILCLVVPATIFFVVELWIGEIERAARAGNVVASIEKRLGVHFRKAGADPPMGWETWLRDRDGKRSSEQQRTTFARTGVIFVLFVVFMAASVAAGLYFLDEGGHAGWIDSFLVVVVVIAGGLVARTSLVVNRLSNTDAPDPSDVWAPATPPAGPLGATPAVGAASATDGSAAGP
ncbi:MAG: hypothetical protein GXY03_10380 [Solirubrobacterales bacterium]|nr:hypothetical protein [Solirubrobacterales bacterium]